MLIELHAVGTIKNKKPIMPVSSKQIERASFWVWLHSLDVVFCGTKSFELKLNGTILVTTEWKEGFLWHLYFLGIINRHKSMGCVVFLSIQIFVRHKQSDLLANKCISAYLKLYLSSHNIYSESIN